MSPLIRTTALVALTMIAAGCARHPAAQPTTEAAAPAAAATGSAAPPAGFPAATLAVSTDPLPAAQLGKCSLDEWSGGPVPPIPPQKTGASFTVRGWASDDAGSAPPDAKLVLRKADKVYAVPLVFDQERPDVADAYKSPGLLKAGYRASAALTGVDAGDYELLIVTGGAKAGTCPTGKQLTVTP